MADKLTETVIQADRDKAADYGLAIHSVSPREAQAIRRGDWDDLPRVQWFASQRLAALSRPNVDEIKDAVSKAIRLRRRELPDNYNKGFDAGLSAAEINARVAIDMALRGSADNG